MAASVDNKSNSSFGSIPSLHKKTSMGGRLLRKPRAPPPPLREPSPPPTKHFINAMSPMGSCYEPSRVSPVPSGAPSLVSPPPSEYHPRSYGTERLSPPPSRKSHHPRSMSYGTERLSPPPSRKSHVPKNELKYVLDPRYREKTSLGTYVEGYTMVKPYKPRGPSCLPARPPKTHPQIINVTLDMLERGSAAVEYHPPPPFTLQDFLLKLSKESSASAEEVKNTVFSRHNYKKLQKLLAESYLPKQTDVNRIYMSAADAEIPSVSPRIPQKQLLVEMAALVKEQMSGIMQTDMKSVIRPLPKYSPNYYKPGLSPPHTEIVLYEDDAAERMVQVTRQRQETELPAHDSIFHASSAKYFQGSRRSNSPFAMPDDGLISPSELAVLDSLISGGNALSLKAHFIAELPDIEPLMRTITYLNVSFNDLRVIPAEVFEISQLTVLKLRNNPITDIPADIGKLQNLRTLVFSFCLVSSLPVSMFNLRKLQHLDFSYNRISFIPNEIKNLCNLRELNVEGNQLSAMPAGALRLQQLHYLRVRNNFMHPLFWRENMAVEPQRLVDLAAMALNSDGLRHRYRSLPDNVQKIMSGCSQCDCCNGVMYGPGLRIIRPVNKIFGIKNLPFLFRSCSIHCKDVFMGSTDSLTDMLYGSQEQLQ